jgi:hypothetical protein
VEFGQQNIGGNTIRRIAGATEDRGTDGRATLLRQQVNGDWSVPLERLKATLAP